MIAYTFSSGGCRDGFYLDTLSSTIEGLSDLIRLEYEDEVTKLIKVDVDINNNIISITLFDDDLGSTYEKKLDLIKFNIK